ncbi:MAG: hypothetical protein QW056_03420 [Candidatus Bathyarchaeia archaeon]
MCDEKSLMMEGEELAKIAVSSGMGSKQISTLYKLAKTRPLAYVEAYVKRQMGREAVRGFAAFARVHELLRKYEGSPICFIKVLMYAAMLYDYWEKEPIMRFRTAAEPLVRRIVEAKGMNLRNISISLHGKSMDVTVEVHRLFLNPKILASEIENALKSKEDFSNLNLKVWIESR